jgi:hypothetical protein
MAWWLTPDEASSRMSTPACARLRSFAHEFEHAMPAVLLKAWSTAEPAVRGILEDIVKIGDPTILDYILQVAKHRR